MIRDSNRHTPGRVLLAALSCALSLCFALATPGHTQQSPPPRTCGNEAVPEQDQMRIRQDLTDWLATHGHRELEGTINVAFHVITDGSNGDVSDAQIQSQIEVLTENFAGTGYSFVLASVDRTINADWYNMYPGSDEEYAAKQALAIDPAHHLNIYTADLKDPDGTTLLGYGYAPWEFDEDSYEHACLLHWTTLPGGDDPQYLGRIATHELGHYLGLLHTFANGCDPGDGIEDTPAEATAAYGCPEGRDTCPDDPGEDPIHNYMDYTDDDCRNNFTPGQDELMDDMVALYRPSLIPCAVMLNNAFVAPSTGDPSTNFEMSVVYQDPGDLPPTVINAVITPQGGNEIRQELIRRDGSPFPEGSRYSGWQTFATGTYTIYFEANNGLCSADVVTAPIPLTVGPAPQGDLYLTDLTVTPMYYSPNGDGRQDSSTGQYTIAGSFCRLGFLQVRDSADNVMCTPETWGWRQPGTYETPISCVLPDGVYDVVAWATNFATGIQTYESPDGWAGWDIALGPGGYIYLLGASWRIDVFDSNIAYVRSISANLDYPVGIHVDEAGNIYVAEIGTSRITKLDNNGNVIMRFGTSHLNLPCDVVTDESGNSYVVDVGSRKVKKFGPGGAYLSESAGSLQADNWSDFIRIIYDGSGYLYVGDQDRVVRFAADLSFDRQYGPWSNVPDSPSPASSVAIDLQGNLIAASSSGQVLQALKIDMTSGDVLDFYYGFGYGGGGSMDFAHSNGLIILPNNQLLTAFGDGPIGSMRKFANSNPSLRVAAGLICDVTPPAAMLSSPSAGDTVRADVLIAGSATDVNFESYALFYREEPGGMRTLIDSSNVAVEDGFLGAWDTSDLPDTTYYLILEASDKAANESADSLLVTVRNQTTSVDVVDSNVFSLSVPRPNPSRVGARLAFELPRDGYVSLRVYDVTGRCVRRLIERNAPAGSHSVKWDGLDESGRQAANGVYLLQLTWEGRSASRRLMLLR